MGDVYVVANPGLDADTINQYNLNLSACAYNNCSSKILNVAITQMNEAPYFVPDHIVINVVEGSVSKKRARKNNQS